MKSMLLSLPANRVRRNYRGGMQLDRLEGVDQPVDSDRPEDWIASTVPARNPGLPPIANEGRSCVTTAAGPNVLLADLFADFADHYLGRRHVDSLGTDLGFLTKLLDSSMRLHIQAHPTAEFARSYLHSRWGKLETYVVLSVRPDSEGTILLGFQRPPTDAEWRRIVLEQDHQAMHACFDPVPVQPGQVWVVPGQVWVVPGGLPHAIGKGLLVMEVMEPTDLVVRCEFEREGIVVPPDARFMGRDPDLAMQIFDYTPLSVEDVQQRCRIKPKLQQHDAALRRELLIGPDQTDCFTITRLTATSQSHISKPSCVQVGVVAGGSGTARVGREQATLQPGAKFLVAAAADAITYTPDHPRRPLTILLCQPALSGDQNA